MSTHVTFRRWLWSIIGKHSTFYRMHGRLIREVTLQQRANRRKKSKLAGLRFERARLRGLSALNTVHVAFINRLERDHPELAGEIAVHQQERCRETDCFRHHHHDPRTG